MYPSLLLAHSELLNFMISERHLRDERQEKATQWAAENKTDYNGRKTIGLLWHLFVKSRERKEEQLSCCHTESDCTVYTHCSISATRKRHYGKTDLLTLHRTTLSTPTAIYYTPTTPPSYHQPANHRTPLDFMYKYRGWKFCRFWLHSYNPQHFHYIRPEFWPAFCQH